MHDLKGGNMTMMVWVVEYQKYIIDEYEKVPIGKMCRKVFTDDQEAYAFKASLVSDWSYDYKIKTYKGIVEPIY